jgi:hypothetical protein
MDKRPLARKAADELTLNPNQLTPRIFRGALNWLRSSAITENHPFWDVRMVVL